LLEAITQRGAAQRTEHSSRRTCFLLSFVISSSSSRLDHHFLITSLILGRVRSR